MIINTENFGQITVNEENVIYFEKGIPGFEEIKDYVLIFEEDENSPFCWMQSIEKSNLAFVLINPLCFYPEYSPEIPDMFIRSLGEPVIEDLALYTIVVIPDEIKDMTANLKAPIIINTKTKKGMQVYLEEQEYLIKCNVYSMLNSQSVKDGE